MQLHTLFEQSIFLGRLESIPQKEKRNKKKGKPQWLYKEFYTGGCKANGEIFSVVFIVSVLRPQESNSIEENEVRKLYCFRLTNIKKLLPHPEQSSHKQRQQFCENAIKNWEKAKKHIVDLGETETAPPKRH